jgi:hypothetical protein
MELFIIRPLIHRPLAWTNSPAPIAAAWPTSVIRSRWPRAFTRSTQKPLSSPKKGDALDKAGKVLALGGRLWQMLRHSWHPDQP